MARVVVLGGGYAGLACLIELSKREKGLELHLVDAQREHCKRTNLHKTLGIPPEQFTVAYAQLAERFDFDFHQQRLDFSRADLVRWQMEQKIELSGIDFSFDWLVVSTGASYLSLPGKGENALNLGDLRHGRGKAMLERLLESRREETFQISLVGGGGSGVQVLFELQELLKQKKISDSIRLVDLNQRLVPNLGEKIHSYIVKKMQRAGIEYCPATRYLDHGEQEIFLEDIATGREYALPSDLVLSFPGVVATPFCLETNGYGQVMAGEQLLPAIFAAGDCSRYDSAGLNSLTAQAAVRKGKLAARNIIRSSRGDSLHTYGYQEKGYLISLGPIDAIGWIGLHGNLVRGFPAVIIKEAMETQYDLFLRGVDTYLGFP